MGLLKVVVFMQNGEDKSQNNSHTKSNFGAAV
jgi:hypothetical protein